MSPPGHRAPGPPALGEVLPHCVHEVNVVVWLGEVSARAGRDLTLAEVPPHEWDLLVLAGVDCVWLMGVWERSVQGRATALADEGNRRAWDEALPGWTEQDVLGSPYCVQDYRCAQRLGGRDGLAAARAALADRGARLLVDLVPNHVAPDHPLLDRQPDAFIRGDADDLERDPEGFVDVGVDGAPQVVAHGRDPYFPPWQDVVQLNAFAPETREFLRDTLLDIADQADGVRCDMAMLLLDDVFGATWGERAGAPLPDPLWVEVLDPVRQRHPGFVVVAEAYWGREPDLLAQGFDACYDKVLYDRFVGGGAADVRDHVAGLAEANSTTVRFLENHDEPRAAATLPPAPRELAGSVALATLPGSTLWHEGQLDGRRIRLPVFLARRADEVPDPEIRQQLTRLLEVAPLVRSAAGAVGSTTWRLLPTTGWPDNPSHDQLLAWAWVGHGAGAPWSLVVVNYSDGPAQGLVELTGLIDTQDFDTWQFVDALDGTTYVRERSDLEERGFYVDLPAWGHHALLARPGEEPGQTRNRSRGS